MWSLPIGLRMILHVDMDAFCASVEERDDREQFQVDLEKNAERHQAGERLVRLQ
jgi:hypothetical protein